jgi:hypothetical protein
MITARLTGGAPVFSLINLDAGGDRPELLDAVAAHADMTVVELTVGS